MKFYSVVLIIAALFWAACDDSLDSIGTGMMPDDDKIQVASDTINIQASTIKMDSLFVKSIQGYLGEYYDPVYGSIRSGFMCQFYPTLSVAFPDSVYKNQIDSVTLNLGYFYSIGDSLSTMEASVFPIKNALPKYYYNTLNPADYCDLNTLYGKQTYTARNFGLSDTQYSQILNSTNQSFVLRIKLPQELGEAFLEESRKPNNAFQSKQAFTTFFPGVFVTSTFGKGCVLPVAGANLRIHFNYVYTIMNDTTGLEETVVEPGVLSFPVTKEIIQLNTMVSAHDASLLEDNPTTMYIKAPAGICPKLTIPIRQLAQKYKGKEFSNVQLTLYSYEDDLQKYSLKYPQRLILISPDSVKTFFENQKLIDRATTYSAAYNNHIYDFSNISYLIQKAINEKPDEDLEMLIMPVSPMTVTNSVGQVEEIGYANLLAPSAISLKKGDNLKLQIITVDKKN